MKQLLVLLLLLCSAGVSAQDVIVKKDGSTIVCRVVEVTDSEITYKKWSDLNGSNYVMDKSLASTINYENGKKESFSEATNLYTPNNQNDGTQQYNDKALLAIDAQAHPKKKRTFKWDVRAGVSLNTMTGGKNITYTYGADVGAGILFPLKNKKIVLGVDACYTVFGAKLDLDKKNDILAVGIGLFPYIGAKLQVNNTMQIMPYIGPFATMLAQDLSTDDSRDNKAIKLRVCPDNPPAGAHVGAKLFITSKFYLDIHCIKSLSSNNLRYYEGERDLNLEFDSTKKHLALFNLTFGTGFVF